MEAVDLKGLIPNRARWPEHSIARGSVPSRKAARRALTIWPWDAPEWWSLSRRARIGNDHMEIARVYLGGHGTEDELEFIVTDPTRVDIPCYGCNGTGRTKYMPHVVDTGLYERPNIVGYNPPDKDGMQVCNHCDGRKAVPPDYGAGGHFCNAPGLEVLYRDRRLTERGLARPTPSDVLAVMRWCDELLLAFFGPLNRRLIGTHNHTTVDVCELCGCWPSRPHSGTCMDRAERAVRMIGRVPNGKLA